MHRMIVLTVGLLIVAGSATVAEEPAGELSREEIVERIVVLRRELDTLMALLPSELRSEVERRLSEMDQEAVVESPTTDHSPVVEAPPPAEAQAAAPTELADSEPAGAAESKCAPLALFDNNDDGFVSGLDRYWRYFKLWRDDGDGDIEEPEVASLYDSGIAQVSTRLTRHTTVDGVAGDVWIDNGVVVVDVPGKRSRSAVLLIDADRLARGGEILLVDADGAPLTGLQPVGEAISFASAGSEPRPLLCP